MDAEDLLLREFLGIRTPQETDEAARWIRSQQRDDGTWANFYGGPGDLSPTVEAWGALRLAGDDVDAPHMQRAAGWGLGHGGGGASRGFTRLGVPVFGGWGRGGVPPPPP